MAGPDLSKELNNKYPNNNIEPTKINDFVFSNNLESFNAFGSAYDLSHPTNYLPSQKPAKDKVISIDGKNSDIIPKSVHDSAPKRKETRKVLKNNDASDIENYTGPFLTYDIKYDQPSHEDKLILEEYMAKRHKKITNKEYVEQTEYMTRHEKNTEKSLMSISTDFYALDFRKSKPKRCSLPKSVICTLENSSKVSDAQNNGINKLVWLPKTGHMLLSCSADSKSRLYRAGEITKHVATYHGHSKSIKDAQFNQSGDQFITASYDTFCKLWDTETGKCINSYSKDKFPLCIKYYPEDESCFLVGQSDKKVLCYDIRDSSIQQIYASHLGEVKTVTFFDDNRRFVSTGTDNYLRLFEWGIPVETKQIKDPGLPCIISALLTNNGTTYLAQCMDNSIKCFDLSRGFRMQRKKTYRGHTVYGFSCEIGISPDDNYVISGDSSGNLFVWDLKVRKIDRKIKTGSTACLSVAWNPYHESLIAAGDTEGNISFIC
ncbi:MAG: pre-mRNA-processing factor 17 [Paramarteilia canceri]